MDDQNLNPAEDEHLDSPETPEDVAVLYTWANVHGGKYRDFSASRREYRAQQRHRMVEAQRQAELEAARSKEEAAARELEEARRREEEAAHDAALKAQAEEARRRAEERAEQERLEAQRHVEVAEELKRAMEQAQREMEEARRRAEEQAARYAEADARYRASTRQQQVPGEIDDPYYYAGHLEPGAFAPGKGVRSSVPQRVSSERRIAESYYRTRGSSEITAARTQDGDDSYRLSSSDQRRGSSSGSRRPYTETRSRPAEPMVEGRIETPEDTRERHRLDELERLSDRRSANAYDDSRDDGYYDHAPEVIAPRPSIRNSSGSDVHIPPRTQQASGERRVMRPEDPMPGNTHLLDSSRVRRRESSTDITARTTRRPRESESMPVPGDFRGDVLHPATEERDRAEAAARSFGSSEAYEAARRLPPQERPWRTDISAAGHDRDRRETNRDVRNEPSGRPEWLLRDASSASVEAARDSQHPEDRGQARESRAYEDRNAPRTEERRLRASRSQFIPAADGGFNLPPLPSDAAPPLRDRSGYREDSGPRAAASYVEDRSVRRDAERSMFPTEPRPEAERRRVDRPSSDAVASPVRPVSGESDARERRAAQAPPADERQASGARSAAQPADTLQQSRERVAARWFALKGFVGGQSESSSEAPVASRTKDTPVPSLSIVSLSGGVGKTSLVATVGRALSSVGERVLLADATPHGLLPYYFGARELRPDVVRTFSPPPGSKDAPVFMVNYEADRLSNDDAGQTALVEEIGRHAKGTQRVLLDLNATSAWLARRLATLHSKILVPIAPDMNSVLGIKAVERFFAGVQDAEGRPVQPYYVLNQFDASLPLHLDVREVLRQQLGDRLLPVMIRRSPSVAEALAEGMTVMDYAPESPVTEDFAHLAEWVRNLAAPAQTGMRSIRWSER